MSDRAAELRAEMDAALERMTVLAAEWLEAFRVDPARAGALDDAHAVALRDFRRAERKLRKLK